MLEHRNLKMDLLALGLLALVVFLAAALLSYDPADPPSKLVFPERAEAAQRLRPLRGPGQPAAVHRLRAWGPITCWSRWRVLDAVLLARRTVGQPILRLAGWLLVAGGLYAPWRPWPRRSSRRAR